MRLTRKELLFTVSLTTNFDACMPNVVGTYMDVILPASIHPWYILMSASALCIHAGMPAYFARPFVHQSVASTRLSVRLMIVYHCARRFIFRLSICPIFCPSVVCLSVCMFTCTYVETNVVVYVLWT